MKGLELMDRSMEGKLYKSIEIADRVFDIYFGYNHERERERWGPSPIFPDFYITPIFTADGIPFARADQDTCSYFSPKERVSGENWCNDCLHFYKGEDIIGLCKCDQRRHIVRKNE